MKLTHLQIREIQAPIAARLIRAYADVMGHDRAVDVALEAIQDDATASGANIAKQLGANGMDELAELVRDVWSKGDALEVDIIEESETVFSFNVTRCGYAEMYDRLGLRDLGYCLSCNRDANFARGFNPRIRLDRTQTIMEGAPFCDFRFTLRKQEESAR